MYKKHRRITSSAQPFVLPGLREHCPRNSPQAAARIVALALVANGEINASEQAAVDDHRVAEQLGLSSADWRDLIGAMRAELRDGPPGGQPGRCPVDPATMASWLDEVDDPALRSLVMRLSRVLVGADGFIDPGESELLRTAIGKWQLPDEECAELEAMVYGLDFQVAPR